MGTEAGHADADSVSEETFVVGGVDRNIRLPILVQPRRPGRYKAYQKKLAAYQD